MKTRIFTILFPLFMSVTSFLPFPTTTLLCLFVAIFRPIWFKRVVDEVYKSKKIEDLPESNTLVTGAVKE